MIKRIAVILGLLVAFGAVAFIAIAIWPESAGNGEAQPTGSNRTLSAAGGPGANGVPGDSSSRSQGPAGGSRPTSRRRSVPTTSASRCSP